MLSVLRIRRRRVGDREMADLDYRWGVGRYAGMGILA